MNLVKIQKWPLWRRHSMRNSHEIASLGPMIKKYLGIHTLISILLAAIPLSAQQRSVKTLTYPDGKQMQEIQVLLEQGKEIKDGKYKSWHPNGALAHSGAYSQGKAHGKWVSWHSTGILWKHVQYRNGVEHGISIEFFEHGDTASISRFCEGTPCGVQRIFHGDNIPKEEVTYSKEGIPQEKKIWFPTGQIMMHMKLKDGKLNGLTQRWAPNGVKIGEIHFKNGRGHGLGRKWSPANPQAPQLIDESNFEEGIKHGRQRSWNESGKLLTDQVFEKGNCIKGCAASSLPETQPALAK